MQVLTVYSKPKSKFVPLSWFIRAFECSRFSHVAVIMHFESFNKLAVFEASGTKVKFVNYIDWTDNNEIVHVYLHKINKPAWLKLANFCFDNVGKNYGIKQIVGMAYARIFKKKNPWADGKKSYVCSELVGHILKDVLGEDIDLDKLEYEGPKYLQQLEAKIEERRSKA